MLINHCLKCDKVFIPTNNRHKYCTMSCYKASYVKGRGIEKEDTLIL